MIALITEVCSLSAVRLPSLACVFLSELLTPVEVSRASDTGLAELRLAAEAERETGYVVVRRAIRSACYSALVARMTQWMASKSWRKAGHGKQKGLDESAEKLASRLLTKRHKAVRKLGSLHAQVFG